VITKVLVRWLLLFQRHHVLDGPDLAPGRRSTLVQQEHAVVLRHVAVLLGVPLVIGPRPGGYIAKVATADQVLPPTSRRRSCVSAAIRQCGEADLRRSFGRRRAILLLLLLQHGWVIDGRTRAVLHVRHALVPDDTGFPGKALRVFVQPNGGVDNGSRQRQNQRERSERQQRAKGRTLTRMVTLTHHQFRPKLPAVIVEADHDASGFVAGGGITSTGSAAARGAGRIGSMLMLLRWIWHDKVLVLGRESREDIGEPQSTQDAQERGARQSSR